MKQALRLGTAACLSFLGFGALAAGVQSLPRTALTLTDRGQISMEVVGHPDPLSLIEDEDPALAANKRLVFDMWRSVVNAGHVELADEMLLEDYIQHSPMLPTGRGAFKKIFSVVERREIPELVSPPLVTTIAEGDLVVMALREELPQPDGDGIYTTTHFNLFRVEDGRLAEHWHSVQGAPGPDLPPAEKGGPQPVIGVVGAEQLSLLQAEDPLLAGNKRLVFNAWLQIIEAGREGAAGFFIDEGFIDHDPNADAGLQTFNISNAARRDAPIPQSISHPLVAIIAQGELVVMVSGREHPHPSRTGETYTTTWFEMFRINDNRLVEHWNGASKPGGALGKYVD